VNHLTMMAIRPERTTMMALQTMALAASMVGVASSVLLAPAAGTKPHIVMHLADDFGWANAGWHRPEGYQEVQTPRMNELVQQGIELDQAYSFKFCSPTRSSLQSGRLPVHVNMVNAAPDVWNPDDPVSGFAAIPRNMTGIASKLKEAGYATHQVGKWDAGMATVDHTPKGRGYDTSFGYFHHDNDYWNEQVSGHVDMYNETATTTWAGPAPDYKPTDGPAYGLNGSCSADEHCGMTGPEEVYEEFKFRNRVLEIINGHDGSDTDHPLFLCYTSHIVHEPLQVPNQTWNHFDFIQSSAAKDFQYHRQTYHAMVYYLDGVVGDMVDALKAKGMWENTLWFHQSDNGGPSFTGSSHTANNYPLKGSKMTDWQGGIRVNAFVSGGLLKKAAPQRIGTKLEGITHVCDFYTTWCSLAGVDAEDDRAKAANLPPVDGVDLWPYLSGQTASSPRTEVFASPTVLVMQVNGTKWKLFGSPQKPAVASAFTEAPEQLNCSVVNEGVCMKKAPIVQTLDGDDIPTCCAACLKNAACIAWNVNTFMNKCFLRSAPGPTEPNASCASAQVRPYTPPPPSPPSHVLVGTACWMGPQYPNGTVDPGCKSTMECPNGCLFNLDADPGEHFDVASVHTDVLAVLAARLAELQPSVFSPVRTGGDPKKGSRAAEARGNFWGPFIFP